MSLHQAVALLCSMLMLWTELAPGARAQQPAPQSAQSLKQTLIEIPGGSIIDVRLHSKQKLRGRLGAISDSGFEIQSVRDGKIQTQTLSFEEVKSVKHQEKGMSTGAKITLGILAGIGVFVLVCLAIAGATNGFSD
jgi:hypothetical protein